MVMWLGVNISAVIVAAVVSFMLGWLWYSPILFGKEWRNLSGLSKKDMKSMKLTPAKAIILGFLSTLLMAFVVSNFITYLGAFGVRNGVQIGFWFWLGFVATTTLGTVLWEGKPFRLYVLNNAYNLAGILLMSAIISVWH